MTDAELVAKIAALRAYAKGRRRLARSRDMMGPVWADARAYLREHARQAEAEADRLEREIRCGT